MDHHNQYPSMPTADHHEVRNGSATQQILNGTHPVIQNTKADFQGLANSGSRDHYVADGEQPLTHYHSLLSNLFTWKYPTASGICLASIISTILAFHYVNVLRYVFKATYILFASVTAVEIAAKPFGSKGVVSSMRPRRYYTVPRESMDRVFVQVHDLLNFFVLEFQRLVFADNIFATAMAFLATFFGYFLIKYMPFWSLLILATVTAFTLPPIYLQNQEFIDEQCRRASEWANTQFHHTRQVTEKYAGDAAVRARATAVDLTHKVQGYTAVARNKAAAATTTIQEKAHLSTSHSTPNSTGHSTGHSTGPDAAPSVAAHTIPSDYANEGYATHNNFPNAPTHEPHVASHHAQEPLLA